MTDPLTWRELAAAVPEFVQWVAQRHGGVPDGPISEADYERYRLEYNAAAGKPAHCGHWAEGDGACCRCGRPNWCPDDGETPEALAELRRAELEGCPGRKAAP